MSLSGSNGSLNGVHPLNSRYEDIELKKSVKYRIAGKVVKKVKVY